MNKTLTISLVAALGLVGGGAYMLMGTNKNFSEYVPNSVSSMLGDYLPSSFKAESIIEPTIAVEESIQFEAQIQEETQEVVIIEPQAEEPQAEYIEEEQVEQQQEVEQNDDNAVSIAMDEIQKSINEVSTPLAVEGTRDNPKVNSITKKIDDANTQISKLDIENKELEERFQNILRKNRELAKKLQEIDKQLTN